MTGRSHFVALGVAFAGLAIPAAVRAQEPTTAKTTITVDKNLANKGKGLWTSRGCMGCHTLGKGKLAGPDLIDVLDRRELEWVKRWLKEPEQMLETDPIAKEMLKEYNNTAMPNMKLKDEEIDQLLHFIAQEAAKKKK